MRPGPEHAKTTTQTRWVATALLLAGLAAARPAAASLSPADHDQLRDALLVLAAGWDNDAVTEANAILCNPAYDLGDWHEFLGEHLAAHPFTDALRAYLGYPMLSWCTADVHAVLQEAFALVAEERTAAAVAAHAADLGPAMEAAPALRSTLFNLHRQVASVLDVGVLDGAGRGGIHDWYLAHLASYPQYWRSSTTLDVAAQPYVGALRAQMQVNLAATLPLTEPVKLAIAQALDLPAGPAAVFTEHGVLIVDNNYFDADQLRVLDALLGAIPEGLDQARAIFDYFKLGNVVPRYEPLTGRGAVNLFDNRVGSLQVQWFPDELSPRPADFFTLVGAHELNHLVDTYSVQASPALQARHQALIAAAGSDRLNYLVDLGDGAFVNSPQELVAYTSEAYFSDSAHLLELALLRRSQGRPHPLHQFLFYLEVYSRGGDSVPFYTVDVDGNLGVTPVAISRDGNDQIAGFCAGSFRHRFTRDAAGDVLDVAAASCLEGDTAPRPDGNGNLSVADWTQVGRYLADLDPAAAGTGVVQRADCAPRSTRGDGRLTIADWVQAGRYGAGLDAPLQADGPDQLGAGAPAPDSRGS